MPTCSYHSKNVEIKFVDFIELGEAFPLQEKAVSSQTLAIVD